MLVWLALVPLRQLRVHPVVLGEVRDYCVGALDADGGKEGGVVNVDDLAFQPFPQRVGLELFLLRTGLVALGTGGVNALTITSPASPWRICSDGEGHEDFLLAVRGVLGAAGCACPS